MRFYKSADKHGVARDDAEHVASHPISVMVLRDEPLKELRIGFDTRARALEVVVVDLHGEMVVIHAMVLRRSYYPLLREGL